MKAKIKLAFRIVIDASSTHLWDRYVFEDTYLEYKIQHQVYDSKEHPTKNFWELSAHNPAAKNIPFLLSATCENYIKQLNGEIRSLPDVLGNRFFKFEQFIVDLVSSNTEDASKHQLGITFLSKELLWIDTVDQKYLLSEETEKKNAYSTYMQPFHPQISVAYYEEIVS